jgi:hypothetical protein
MAHVLGQKSVGESAVRYRRNGSQARCIDSGRLPITEQENLGE